jgi:hypothetical protein
MMSPTIRIDDDVYDALKERAEPFVDTPNTVLRRVLGLTLPEADEPEELAPGEVQHEERPAPPAPRASRPRRQSRGRRSKPKGTRAPKGSLLAEDEYELPLLQILAERGGRAPTREVLEELERRLDGRLTPGDREHLKTGGVRWRQRAQFVRLRLVEAGDMIGGSPRGVWEISDQGRARVGGEAS